MPPPWIAPLIAGFRTFKSPKTRLIHWDDSPHPHVIPIYENFCYAVALMRSMQKENYLEAKELIERLLPFRCSDGHFPAALHDYPYSATKGLAATLQLPFQWLKLPFPDSELPLSSVEAHLVKKDFSSLASFWNHSFGLYMGQVLRFKKGFDYQEEVIDRIFKVLLGEVDFAWTPHFAPLALLSEEALSGTASPSWMVGLGGKKQPLATFFEQQEWFSIFAPEAQQFDLDTLTFEWNTPLDTEQRSAGKEVQLFFSQSIEPKFFVKDRPVTTFTLDQQLEVRSQKGSLLFSFEAPFGDYRGHLSLGNRPNQSLEDEAYDWIVSIKTLRRSKEARLRLSFESLGC